MYNFTKTFVFKELIPTYDRFLELYEDYIIEPLYVEEHELERVYKILYNNYCNCSVAYDTPNAFFRMFFLEIFNSAEDYIIKLKMVKKLRELTVDELVSEYETITNVANNDNAVVSEPLKHIVPYITTQSSSASKGNKANAILRGLSAYRDNEVKYFVDKFQYLFLTIFGDYGIYYVNN